MTGPAEPTTANTAADPVVPGEIRSPDTEIELAAGLARRRLSVTSRSGRPIRVSSHYPFWRVNARLEFDRAAATGFRLDIPAGTSVRWSPGETRQVDLVALAGTGQWSLCGRASTRPGTGRPPATG